MFVTVREAASLLNLPRSTIYRAVEQGEIASKRVGRSVYLLKESLMDWANAALRAPTAA